MPEEEFTPTPYAASFGPPPSAAAGSAAVPPLSPSRQQPSRARARPDPGSDEFNSHGSSPPRGPPAPKRIRHNYGEDLDAVVDAELGESGAQILAKARDAVNRLGAIALSEQAEWQREVAVVLAGLEAVQMRWRTLEAERRQIIRPLQSAYTGTRGGRGRGGRGGRGRGRGRGRWRS